MANSITAWNKQAVEITAIDSDWQFSDTFPFDMGVLLIQFVPGADTDRCVIKAGDAAGPIVFDVSVAATTDHRVQYFYGEQLNLFLDVSEGSYNANAKVIIVATDRRLGPRH